jgi:hypothetical protein
MPDSRSQKRAKILDLSHALTTLPASVEDLLDEGRHDALEELLGLVENDPECKTVLPNWDADRHTVAELYWFLLRSGAGYVVEGQYLPCMAVADPWALEYMLASREVRQLNRQAAWAVAAFCASGCKDRTLLRGSHAFEVAMMRGPNRPRTSGIYRPYSITAMHRLEAEEWEEHQLRRARRKRWLNWLGAILGAFATVGVILGLLGLRK